MKKNILIIALMVMALFSTACRPKDSLDPRKVERDIYETTLRHLSKKYDDKNSDAYDPEKSFDIYLTHVFRTPGIFTWDDCAERIESDYKEFDLIYFKQDAKERLKSFCNYSIQELIDIGDEYAHKTKYFDYNNLNAMYFYYSAHSKSLNQAINDDYDLGVIKSGKESYYKFKNIRNQFPIEIQYIDLANYIPFDQYDSEDY